MQFSSQLYLRYHLLGVVVNIFTEGGALLGALGAVTWLGGNEGVLLAVVRQGGGHHQEEGQGQGEETGEPHPANSKSSSQSLKKSSNNHIIEN